MTEILRILMLDAKVVIMDEPTAALTERETATLFKHDAQNESTRRGNRIYLSPYGRGI